MGSRSADTLKDIEKLRASLDDKLEELERRLPIAGLGRKGVAMLASSGLAGSVAAFAWRRLRSRRSKRKGAPAITQAPVVVNVVPKSTTAVAFLAVAVWAGVKVYEVYWRSSGPGGERFRPAVVKPMSESERRSGAGS